jgi:hypothetical protein
MNPPNFGWDNFISTSRLGASDRFLAVFLDLIRNLAITLQDQKLDLKSLRRCSKLAQIVLEVPK